MINAENLEKYKPCMSNQDWVFTYLESTSASYVALYHQKGVVVDMWRVSQASQETIRTPQLNMALMGDVEWDGDGATQTHPDSRSGYVAG
jgi:hypothetical protein